MSRRQAMLAECSAAVMALSALLAGCSDASTVGDASSPATTRPPSTPQAKPSTGRSHDYAVIDETLSGSLIPGPYALVPVGPVDQPLAVVDIPAGYTSWGPFIVADAPEEPDDPLAIGLWEVTGVFKNACTASRQSAPGSSVRALADALVHQKVTSATKPRPITLAGYHGLYLEITSPTNLDYTTCDDNEVNLWDSRPDGGYWTMMPGMVNRLWLLDVHGQPTVMHMAVPPSATHRQIDQLTNIIQMARFTDR